MGCSGGAMGCSGGIVPFQMLNTSLHFCQDKLRMRREQAERRRKRELRRHEVRHASHLCSLARESRHHAFDHSKCALWYKSRSKKHC